jgi:hypothetical protein
VEKSSTIFSGPSRRSIPIRSHFRFFNRATSVFACLRSSLFHKIIERLIIASLHKFDATQSSVVYAGMRESRMNTAYFSTQ